MGVHLPPNRAQQICPYPGQMWVRTHRPQTFVSAYVEGMVSWASARGCFTLLYVDGGEP